MESISGVLSAIVALKFVKSIFWPKWDIQPGQISKQACKRQSTNTYKINKFNNDGARARPQDIESVRDSEARRQPKSPPLKPENILTTSDIDQMFCESALVDQFPIIPVATLSVMIPHTCISKCANICVTIRHHGRSQMIDLPTEENKAARTNDCPAAP